MRSLSMFTALVAACALTACSHGPTVSESATIAINAIPCYEAVKGATSAANTVSNVQSGVTAALSSPACVAVDNASLAAIQTVTAPAPVVAPVSK